MRTDFWDQAGKRSSVNDHPTQDDVVEALARLDRDIYTELTVERPDVPWIGGGGGPDRFFFNYLLPEDEGSWVLSENPDAEGSTSLAIGRNLADFPNNQIAGRDTAENALAYFLTNNARNPSLKWLKTF